MIARIAITSLLTVTTSGLIGVDAAAQRRAASSNTAKPAAFQCARTFTTGDWVALLRRVQSTNPQLVEKMFADAKLRETQTANIRELLAISCEAVRSGLAAEAPNVAELENIALEIAAVEYDTLKRGESNKNDKPFSSITPVQVAAFYKIPGNEAKAELFIANKMELLRASGTFDDDSITDEMKAEAREHFAKISLMHAESKLKGSSLDPSFRAQTALQTKLQQAQFLAAAVSELADHVATEEEIAAFAAPPEFDVSEKRLKAEGILRRAAGGEDFATLANEFSEDPGNISEEGKRNGGLYADVRKGTMVAPFEAAALALEPGGLSPQLVETDFGFHIIKLEKKTGTADDLVYDVRHILISTMMEDPADPDGQEIPIKEYIRRQVEEAKKSEWIEKIIAANPVTVSVMPIKLPPAPKVPAKSAARKRSR